MAAPSDKDFDLVIIGSGPAGQKAAISAAKSGARVALVERDPLAGGVCLNTGTIPSKTLREAVLYFTGYRQRGYYGAAYRFEERVTPQQLLQRTNHVIRMERESINESLAMNDVSRLVGSGRLVGPHEVAISIGQMETRVTAGAILVAVGTTPRRPDDIPFDDTSIFDSDAVFGRENQMRPLPQSIIVLGAGVIGIEYACMFAALDIPTILADPRPNPLSFVDQEIARLLYSHLISCGVGLRFGVSYKKVEIVNDEGGSDGTLVRAALSDGSDVTADALLFALGRTPGTASLGLAEIGVTLDKRGQVVVDETYRTNIPSIYAAGDVIGFPSLASTSAEQGRVAALNALGQPVSWHPNSIPYGIYTIPEISMVGKTEGQAEEDKTPYCVGTALWRETARGKILGDYTGALKMVFHAESRKLLGVHIIGEGATELLHIGQAVMHFEGGPEYFLNNVFNYPTLAEAYKIAAYNAMNRLAGTAHTKAPLLEQVYEGHPPPELAELGL